MFRFIKRKNPTPISENTDSHSADNVAKPATEPKTSLIAKLKQGLAKTRASLGGGLGRLLTGKVKIDKALLEELEEHLLAADLGVSATEEILTTLPLALKSGEDSHAIPKALKSILLERLAPVVGEPMELADKPSVILMVGINGAGKTTTIGKLAHRFKAEGKKVVLAAGDTFRAAAVEQLVVWGERNDVKVVKQQSGADSAAVIYDALASAKAMQADILLADTAGRLHTQDNLMEELKKLIRVLKKQDETAPHEILLVLDASIGQNSLNQAKQFHEAIGVSGIVMTKLDGTAKGGVIFALAKELNLPIRYIGVGEGVEDLRPFEAAPFVDALF